MMHYSNDPYSYYEAILSKRKALKLLNFGIMATQNPSIGCKKFLLQHLVPPQDPEPDVAFSCHISTPSTGRIIPETHSEGVGTPIHLDKSTIKRTRPSCAQVKVLVDLKKKFPKYVIMNIEDEVTGEVRSTVVDIRYDYVSKSFCRNPQKQQEVVVHHYERKDFIPIHHQKTILENAVDITNKASNNQKVTEEMTMDSDENKTEYLEIEDNSPHIGDTDSNQSVKGNHEIDRPEDVLDNIALERDLSPRLLKSARKRKKQEKIGGLPVLAADYEDFETWISSCDLQEVNFKGSPYTWWNGRAGKDCIFERHRKLFRLLKFWTENDTFMEVVRLNWCTTSSHNPYLDFKENIKSVKVALTRWSREAYGNIFKKLLIREDIMKIKEKLFEEEPSVINREVLQRAQAEYKKYLHFEEKFWQQKTGYDWLENGDRNTRGNTLPKLITHTNLVLFPKKELVHEFTDLRPISLSYGLPKCSDNLNHLVYADDTIIFTSSNKYSLERIMEYLQEYETESGQKINKHKSAFILHQNVAGEVKKLVEECTGFTRERETVEHLFIKGEMANIVWKYFSQAAGIIALRIQRLLIKKFGYANVPKSWPHMIAILDEYRPKFQYKLVKWCPPPTGDILGARGLKIVDSTKLIVQAIAIRERLSYCFEKQLSKVIIKIDSMALVHILNGEWEVPWRMTVEVNSINRLRNALTVPKNYCSDHSPDLSDGFVNSPQYPAGIGILDGVGHYPL
ncbi:hypothetical protein MTR67_013315 [Solanum verrucosum]|uniref:Reverse transcriptase domain-containing protein n=1 Tax=Solanum verrucosum TaxID=315347 RepID=A0AAF0TNQ8_SOLVR|nr:hypothetical protein MTR67_013315 [Solanum verrucosum]